jgi:periplasmic divalent cation tolerance protein
METTEAQVVGLITAPVDRAAAIARAIVERRLAACVNIVHDVRSIYWWDGAVQDDTESLLVVKTTSAMVPALNEALVDLHPYDTFELVVLDITDGNPPYLEWIGASITGAG